MEPPDWYTMIEEALNEPDIPDSVAVAMRKILDDWIHEVSEAATHSGYWEWVESKLEQNNN